MFYPTNPLSIKDLKNFLFPINKKRKNSLQGFELYGQSTDGLLEILKEKNICVIYIPEFICEELVFHLEEFGLNIRYYKLNEFLAPMLTKELKEELLAIDRKAFLIVNYFGINRNTEVKTLKKYGCFLVEDNTHFSSFQSNSNSECEIELYSPYKHHPIKKIGVIKRNDLSKEELKTCREINYTLDLYWFFRKIIQRFVFVKNTNHQITNKTLINKKIDYFSKRFLFSITENCTEQRTLKEKQKELLSLLLSSYEIPFEIDSGLSSHILTVKVCEKNIENFENKLTEDKVSFSFWPKRLSYNGYYYLTIPFQYNNSIKKLISIIRKKIKQNSNNYVVKCLDGTEFDQLKSQVEINNVLSNISYLKSKNEEVIYVGMFCRDEVCAITSIRYVKNYFLKLQIINRSPLFRSKTSSFQKLVLIDSLTRSGYIKGILLFAPNLMWSQVTGKLIRGFELPFVKKNESFVLDLNKSEVELNKGLSSKWRNQRKKAEDYGCHLEINTGGDLLDQALCEYDNYKKLRSFDGVESSVVRNVYELDKDSVDVVVAQLDGKFLGAMVFLRDMNFSTYIIGVSNEEGKRVNVNNLMIWNMILFLKNKKGIKKLDLGGVDFKKNNGIAHFKKGIGGTYYKELGVLCGWF